MGSPFGPFYQHAPQLQRALDHAERLADVLKTTRAREDDDSGSAWLIGRSDEMELFVEIVVGRWRFEGLDESAAAAAVRAYVEALHDGLASNFGETTPRCCIDSLYDKALPAPSLSQTTKLPVLSATRDRGETLATTSDVDLPVLIDRALLTTPAPSTPPPTVH